MKYYSTDNLVVNSLLINSPLLELEAEEEVSHHIQAVLLVKVHPSLFSREPGVEHHNT